jgi:hypothetical protein
MPRMDPLRKKSSAPDYRRRNQQEPIANFLRNLLFSSSQPSEPSTTERLIESISPIWDKTISPTLLAEFGNVATLYAIFYATDHSDEVVLEVWDPAYVDSKPAEVFRLRGLPDVARQLPAARAEAKIITLERWY